MCRVQIRVADPQQLLDAQRVRSDKKPSVADLSACQLWDAAAGTDGVSVYNGHGFRHPGACATHTFKGRADQMLSIGYGKLLRIGVSPDIYTTGDLGFKHTIRSRLGRQ